MSQLICRFNFTEKCRFKICLLHQDSISYWDDFSKPKIVYPETTQGAYFAIDNDSIFVDKTCFILITKVPKYIQSTLSSKLFEYAYRRIFSSIELVVSGFQYNKHALVKLPIYMPIDDTVLSDLEVYALYGINDSERNLIESQCIQ